MKILMIAIAATLALGGASLPAESHGQGNGKKHGKHDQSKGDNDRGPDTNVAIHVVFGSGDVTIIRNHYEPRYRNLPKGLQKKLARGGSLPPGWRKKFEPFPVAIERRLAPLPDGYRRGVLDGHAVIYNARTNVMVDIAVLF